MFVLAAAAILTAGGYAALRLAAWCNARAKVRRARRYREIIWRHARANALPTELVAAVIVAESGGKPDAVSKKNARGLMQITPIAEREVLERTAGRRGDLFDPEYNILIGTAYLRMLLDRFGGDLHLALAAYHAGPSRLAKLRRRHPGLSGKQLVENHAPRSTARYCRQVLGRR